MARIELAPEVLDDFDRFVDHMERFEASNASGRIASLVDALQILSHSPRIGRPAPGGLRELVIGQQAQGCVALYGYVSGIDTVFVLALRSQREVDFKR